MPSTPKSRPELDPQPPLSFTPRSNGEQAPFARTALDERADALYRRIVEEKAPRLGMSRREFTESACGMAAVVFVVNQVYGCAHPGGAPAVPAAALEDQAHARDLTTGSELVFDVQVHNRVPMPPWTNATCAQDTPMICPTAWIRQVFVDSDTEVACLSGFPRVSQKDQPAFETRDKIKETVDRMSGSPRLLVHANVEPGRGAPELDEMNRATEACPVAAWKTYPDRRGGLDTDEVGQPFIERARKLGVKVIAAHRGIGNDKGVWDGSHSPRDVVGAAKASPDFKFLVYHAAWQAGENLTEGPFDPADPAPTGVNRLIKAVLDAGFTPNGGNVYAELGSTWYLLMKDATQVGHVLGKLLKYLGPERILWGTDCVLNDGPQVQLAMFRNYQIPERLQEAHGYPALTPEVKRQILGLNGARVYGIDPKAVRKRITKDDIAALKLARREDPRSLPAHLQGHGPRTRREYLSYLRWSGEG